MVLTALVHMLSTSSKAMCKHTFMFCVLRITETQTGHIIFKEELSASPFKMRPLFLVLGKECLDNLKEVEICVKERQANQHFALEMENGTSH